MNRIEMAESLVVSVLGAVSRGATPTEVAEIRTRISEVVSSERLWAIFEVAERLWNNPGERIPVDFGGEVT